MRIILKEYLASLKERGELDKSVLPNLLSELGLRVLNTPMIGTRQNGVDIAAVGKIKGQDEQKYLYLFCIKAGNITRRDWEVSEQSVRPELNEIKDVYLRSNVDHENGTFPVKICLCCGGELEETVLVNWAGYTEQNKTENISFELWNGDRLAELMMSCLLARELLEDEPRRNFQKAVAMVNEPKACYEYTQSFLISLLLAEHTSRKDQLLKLRQSYICLHAVISWAIDADNLESAYKTSELALLLCWDIVRKIKKKKKLGKHDRSLVFIFDQFFQLFLQTSERYLLKVAYPHANQTHSLSVAVLSREPIDVNIAMFELIGRLALHGIWTEYISKSFTQSNPNLSGSLTENINNILDKMVSIINNNPTLHTPIRDEHMIEVALVMYLAQLTQSVNRFLPWINVMSEKTTFALLANTQYPTCFRDYADLLSHPKNSEQTYRDDACAGSILYPYIYFWAQWACTDDEIRKFAKRLEEQIPQCTHQAWFPDEDSDNLIWRGDTYHGVCVTDLSPDKGHKALLEMLNQAMATCTEINDISAIRSGLEPLFLTACRHYRLPIPPSFWHVNL